MGCTRLTVHNGSDVQVSYYPGIAVISVVGSERQGSYVGADGVGFIVGRDFVTLGWQEEQRVLFPDPAACQAIFLVTTERDLSAAFERLRSSMPASEGICLKQRS